MHVFLPQDPNEFLVLAQTRSRHKQVVVGLLIVGSGRSFVFLRMAAATEEYDSAALQGRELEWAKNSPELLEAHAKANNGIVRTRFPPEPNGFLHIGHAKSMNMNFKLAFEKLGVPMEKRRTIFRYDDTNPDAETKEYIDSLLKDLQWLGWEPERTTYSSDNFQALHDFAVVLIKRGLAYVCDMTKQEMEVQRDLCMKRVNAKNSGHDPDKEFPIPSPDIIPGRNRNTDVERNLELFDKMKRGFFDEGSYTLRLKMDLESSNPTMWDLVAYRIKYTAHPHAGKGWCIYPSYDWTHGTCDSLEHVDYSICTLEFEARRECYYWILNALDLYRPKVYEMSRLNLQYTVLSKRRLIKLVDTKRVRGWDDPRMPTVSGLRRRGYTAAIVNGFCDDVGATRSANVVEIAKLHQTARVALATTSRRCMAALDPIHVVITNWDELNLAETTFSVQNIATDEAQGAHNITITKELYIDSSDFRMEDSPTYYGLAPNKAVGLKYQGGNLLCNRVVEGKPLKLECTLDVSVGRPKPKTYISWVPSNGIKAEVRVYNELFTVAEPSDLWEDELNSSSEVVYETAIIDPSIKEVIDHSRISRWSSNIAFQFERMGYFCVDYETTPEKLVFNRTVTLKEEAFKKQLTKEEEEKIAARKLAAKQDVERKAVRMKIDAVNLFQEAEEYKGKYSKYNDQGIPTHNADGSEVTKSATKKLTKEQAKHKKQQAAWQKNQKK